jgi:hypothetical protein
MQQLKKNPSLAELPAPVLLTPDQLVAIAAGTAAILRGTTLGPIIVAGGIFGGPINGPIPVPQLNL